MTGVATLLDDAGEPFQDMPLTMWPPPEQLQFGGLTLAPVSLRLDDYLGDQEPAARDPLPVSEAVTLWQRVRAADAERRAWYRRAKRGDA